MCQMVLRIGLVGCDRAFWNENKVSQSATADWGKFFALSQRATGQKKESLIETPLKRLAATYFSTNKCSIRASSRLPLFCILNSNVDVVER